MRKEILTKTVSVRKSPFASIGGNILSQLPTPKEDIILKEKEKEKLEYGLSGHRRSRHINYSEAMAGFVLL